MCVREKINVNVPFFWSAPIADIVIVVIGSLYIVVQKYEWKMFLKKKM